jgi:hypothetical protein
VSGLRYGTGHAHVDDRGRAVLRIPIVATSLHPTPLSLPSCKLTLDAIRDLVRFASCVEGTGRLIPRASACPQADAEPFSTITSRHHREGEP